MFTHRAEVEKLLTAYADMARLCRQNAWSSPAIAVDCNVDFLAPKILEVIEYEHHHRLINVRETLTSLNECPPDEVYSTLAQTDFVLLSKRTGPRHPRFPFDRQMEAMHPELLKWCAAHCTELTRLKVFDREIVVYVRKR
jgi:hypothetical protein